MQKFINSVIVARTMDQKQISLNEIYVKLLELEKSMKKMDQYIEDLEFARRTEEAWQEIDEGKYTKYNSPEEFLATFKNARNKRN